jgi:uncharacterized protein DUF5060
MLVRSMLLFIVLLCAVTWTIASATDRLSAADVSTTEWRNADSIPRYGVFELSFQHQRVYDNHFFDVVLEVVFISPNGTARRVKGFFYGGDIWKVRFSPDEPGRWTYTYTMTGKGGFHHEGVGAFDCTPSDADGPVRPNPENPHRWVFANGKPYFPIGLQDCIGAREGKLGPQALDGEGRDDGKVRKVSTDEYLSIYSQAGFNLLRFSQDNCSYQLFDDLDAYHEAESKATDELLLLARQHGLRVMFGFFGFYRARTLHGGYWQSLQWFVQKVFAKVFGSRNEIRSDAVSPQVITKEKQFIAYCIARWGVYVDFWQLLNERYASDEWTSMMADYVRSLDPDRKPITTSWPKPSLPAIDINAPHWYESESELQSDRRVQEVATSWKQAGKPVIVGEQGNTGMNWDPLSGQRMRIRTWTALFQEISFVFWNTSWSKAGMHGGRYSPGEVANIYLGPEERGYIRVLQDFASRLDAGVRMMPVEVSLPNSIRGYGLLSSRVAAAYVHHFENHTTSTPDATITLELPGTAPSTHTLIGAWIDPASGAVIAHVQVPPGRQTLAVPPFTVDLALVVSSD